jgi:signal transduction histidine kinase
MSMSFEQAMDVLQRMQNAAPPIAASKLAGVIDLLGRLQAETQDQPGDALPEGSRLLHRARHIPEQIAPAEPPVEQTLEVNTSSLFGDDPVLDDPFSFADLYSHEQLSNLPDTADLFRDLPEFGATKTDDLKTANVDSVLGINPETTPAYTPYEDEEEEIYPQQEDFDFESLLKVKPTYDDLPPFQETPGGQTDELSKLFDNLPVSSSPSYQFEEAERTFQEAQTFDIEPAHPLEVLFGSTKPLSDEYSPPERVDTLPDWFTNIVPEEPDKPDTAPLPTITTVLPSFDDMEQQYGDTRELPPNTVLSGDDGMYALDDLVRFASNAINPTHETNELPIPEPSAAALLTNMNEALRPSLMLLRAQAEMLEDRIAEAVSEDEANMLRLMRDNAETALKLLDSLEQVMQLSDNALKLNVERFEVIPLLREAGRMMQDRARARRHRITVQLDESLPPLRGDYQRVLTLLTDLMDNAVRYTPVGGSSRITVDLMGNCLLFTVADTGIGLTPQDMEYIGQPFWRASHQALVRQQPGTGLRLYLARRILEMHGGELFYSGEPNIGSSFSFTLPVGA